MASVSSLRRSTTPAMGSPALQGARSCRAICAMVSSRSVRAEVCGVTVIFGMAPERMLGRQRLGAEHVERGAGQVAAVQQSEQVFVHQVRTASDVDRRSRPACSRAEVAGVHDVARVRRQRQQARPGRGVPARKSSNCAAPGEAAHARHVLARCGSSRATGNSKCADERLGHALRPSTPRPITPTGKSARAAACGCVHVPCAARRPS